MRKHPLIRRAAKTAGALAIALGASLGSANAASAAVGLGTLTCKSGVTSSPRYNYNVCFSITPSNGVYRLHVGIDVTGMSASQAATIMAAPGNNFSAYLIGDDPSFDNSIRPIALTWEANGDNGVGAELDYGANYYDVDEDWEGRDELYARVKLWHPGLRNYLIFESDNVEFDAELIHQG
jgi:hypothetical protein